MSAGVLDNVHTLADLVHRLGDVPLSRIRIPPAPETATEEDLIRINATKTEAWYELIDRTLVATGMAIHKALMVPVLCCHVMPAAKGNGIVLVSGAFMRLHDGSVRTPDFCFIAWNKFPDGKIPRIEIADIIPDLVVEILSEGNTRRETGRKLREYFRSGTRLMWVIDSDKHSIEVHSSPDDYVELKAGDTLDGGEVLPKFRLSVQQLFEEAEEFLEGDPRKRKF